MPVFWLNFEISKGLVLDLLRTLGVYWGQSSYLVGVSPGHAQWISSSFNKPINEDDQFTAELVRA